jgi:hypothetical protein
MAAKDVEVKARVTSSVREQLANIARKKGEALSLVVREAINEYLKKRKESSEPPRNVSNFPSQRGKVIYPTQKKRQNRA